MKIKIEDAQNLEEYIKWYVSKAYNVPGLEQRLKDAVRMIERYRKKELTVELKLP